MQAALRAEHFKQLDDIERIVEHFAAKQGDLYAVTGGRRAHQDVPRDIAEEVDRWLTEPIVQSALRKLSAMHDVVAGSPEYQRRIDLVYDLIYPRAKAQVPPLDDAQTAPPGAAVSPPGSDTDLTVPTDEVLRRAAVPDPCGYLPLQARQARSRRRWHGRFVRPCRYA